MKKIVPFNKDIDLDTNIAEINSISLEHTLQMKEDNLISGTFIVSGQYKMTQGSINVDPFNYELPFDISIDKKYDTKNVIVDINDFYYELINNKILRVNIEVSVDGIEEKSEREVDEVAENKEETLEEVSKEELSEENLNQETLEVFKEENTSEERENLNVKSIFDGIDENEKYAVYKVHMVTENDTIESILQKYEVTKEQLDDYNELTQLKIGDKLIVPTSNAQN